MQMTVAWVPPAFRALFCPTWGHHVEIEGRTEQWCPKCDTGLCNDCFAPVFFHEECGDYHHIYLVPDCFLTGFRCSKVEEVRRDAS